MVLPSTISDMPMITAILAGNSNNLQVLLSTVNYAGNTLRRKMNVNGIKFRIISFLNVQVSINGDKMEWVTKFKYL